MLQSLFINNIALIEKLNIDFHSELNIFSGETGAGKSIIIDSLNFMLGAKTDKTLIRNGENQAVVQGVFDISKRADIKILMEEIGLEEEDLLIVSRLMSVKGKNEIRINGKVVTLSMLREISHKLVDVHGQSEHFMLSKVTAHLELVDNFAKSTITKIKEDFANAYTKLNNLQKELGAFGGSEAEMQRLIDLYSFQVKEIDEANLEIGEEESLLEKYKIIMNIEKISSNLSGAITSLSGEAGALTTVGSAFTQLNTIASMNDKITGLVERLKVIKFECADIDESLKDVQGDLAFDERESDKITDRIEQIKKLKRKYGADVNAVLVFRDKAKAEYDKLTSSEELIADLKINIEKQENITLNIAEKLSEERKIKSAELEKYIVTELKELGMENSRFEVMFKDNERKTMTKSTGLDDVEFMFSANLGEPMKPLIKVISGGEMSRFMLALKSITSELDDIDTMIFDEIDSGISGKIAHVVAEKFIKISRHQQIIVITHLPQIASTGDCNLFITKAVENGATKTSISPLSQQEKILEVARLSGGNELTNATLAHAEELISHYDKIKEN